MVLLKISPNPNSNSYSVNLEADDLETLKEKIESVFHLKVKNITAVNGVTIIDNENYFKTLVHEYKIDSFSFSTNSFNDEFRLDELEIAYKNLLKFFVRNLTNVLIKVFIRKNEYQNDNESRDLNNCDLMKLSYYMSFDNDPVREKLYNNFKLLIEKKMSENIEEGLSNYRTICAYYSTIIKKLLFNENSDLESAVPEKSQLSKIDLFANSDNNLEIQFRNCHLTGASGFIEKALLVWKNILSEARKPTPNEFLMIHLAYYRLKLPGNAQCLIKHSCGMGTPGFRGRAQTFMAITDSGEGHLSGTIFKKKWLDNGVLVNLENLEIAKCFNRQSIDSDRIPSFSKFKWVRLNVADIAPQTLYVGRMNSDSIKFSHLLVSCLDNMFSIGAAECKLSIGNLTAYECVKHMREIVFELTKNPYQMVCASWNLNAEFRDDLNKDDLNRLLKMTLNLERNTNDLTVLKDRFEIGKLAIMYTKLGGFDKIAWEGDHDNYTSLIPYQLKISEAFTLVHLAHSVGLSTYFSGGFGLKEIKFGVLIGADGIGVDDHTLCYKDRITGNHGPFQQENINSILEERTRFEDFFIGKCVLLLCRLDTMFYEGSITKEENEKRLALFNLLNAIYTEIDSNLDEDLASFDRLLNLKSCELEMLKNSLDYVLEFSVDNNTNLKRNVYLNRLARFNRNNLELNKTLLLENFELNEIDQFSNRITEILRENSEQKAFAFYANKSWKKYVQMYQDEILKQIFRNFIIRI